MHLQQLLQNLVGNALKYRGEEPVGVRVSATTEPDGHRFTIVDNGIGIDPPHADRVFEVFKRLHTRQEFSGTGSGLAICKAIVDRHGGKIWVESRGEGTGSRFHFTLPRVD
ncbi:MAG TPA: ATP-binding protein [Gammaproteobacteria bacterium]